MDCAVTTKEWWMVRHLNIVCVQVTSDYAAGEIIEIK